MSTEVKRHHEKSLEKVKSQIKEVISGKVTLSEMLDSIGGVRAPKVTDKKPPMPKALTQSQLDALQRLPDVYGKVVVTADRALTKKEIAQLVEEREVIDQLLSPLKARKDESIREVLANHFDNVLDDDAKASAPKDAKGHYAVKQEIAVEGADKKIQRLVSGGKPRLSIEHIESLHAEGLIDRKTYLAVTRAPDLPRVLDESGLHRAIQKDPKLFFLLGSVAEPTLPTTTIKVAKG